MKWAAVLVALALPAGATENVALTGTLNGPALTLEWAPVRGARATLFRRELGQTGVDAWKMVAEGAPNAFRITDPAMPDGTAWEYTVRLDRPGRAGAQESPRYGVWVAGSDVPATADHGEALLVVDQTLTEPLKDRLDRLTDDLTGAGWQVVRHDAPRATDKPAEDLDAAATLRAWIADRWKADPATPRTLLLIGHLPVVHTGRVVPDGHEPHAAPSDLYYADTDGLWPRTVSPEGVPQLLPSRLPSPIEMPVGRVDFARLGAAHGAELDLLEAYLDRNHDWRQGMAGDPRKAYGRDDNLKVERAALPNIVSQVIEAGHGAKGGPFLLGVDFGPWDGATYPSLIASAAFAINFGSGKHRFDAGNNAMTALLARDPTLAVGWGGRPAWQMNGLALGDSLGAIQMRTVNNGNPREGMALRDYPATGNYDWLGAPWVNLLGDPTLVPFPLAPVRDAAVTREGEGLRVTWTLPDGADGARLFAAQDRAGPYALVGETVKGTEATVPDAPWLMIRAEGLTTTPAGSFRRLAQGVFLAAP